MKGIGQLICITPHCSGFGQISVLVSGIDAARHRLCARTGSCPRRRRPRRSWASTMTSQVPELGETLEHEGPDEQWSKPAPIGPAKPSPCWNCAGATGTISRPGAFRSSSLWRRPPANAKPSSSASIASDRGGDVVEAHVAPGLDPEDDQVSVADRRGESAVAHGDAREDLGNGHLPEIGRYRGRARLRPAAERRCRARPGAPRRIAGRDRPPPSSPPRPPSGRVGAKGPQAGACCRRRDPAPLETPPSGSSPRPNGAR